MPAPCPIARLSRANGGRLLDVAASLAAQVRSLPSGVRPCPHFLTRVAVQPSVQPSRSTGMGDERQQPTSRAGHRQRPMLADRSLDLCKAGVRGSSPLGSTTSRRLIISGCFEYSLDSGLPSVGEGFGEPFMI